MNKQMVEALVEAMSGDNSHIFKEVRFLDTKDDLPLMHEGVKPGDLAYTITEPIGTSNMWRIAMYLENAKRRTLLAHQGTEIEFTGREFTVHNLWKARTDLALWEILHLGSHGECYRNVGGSTYKGEVLQIVKGLFDEERYKTLVAAVPPDCYDRRFLGMYELRSPIGIPLARTAARYEFVGVYPIVRRTEPLDMSRPLGLTLATDVEE